MSSDRIEEDINQMSQEEILERYRKILKQEVMTIEDIMIYLKAIGYQFSSETIRRWIREEKIPSVRPYGARRIHVRKEDLDNFLKSEKQGL